MKIDKYNLIVYLNRDTIVFSIAKNEEIIAQISKKYFRDLSSVMITCLDKLLKKTNMNISNLASYSLETSNDMDGNNTSSKIATAFLEGMVVRHI